MVTIGAPLPLPTTAAQNGPWNVGITGTPTVQLAGTPTVQLSGTPTVQLSGTQPISVANPSAAPLFFVNINDPGRIPYQSSNPRLAR